MKAQTVNGPAGQVKFKPAKGKINPGKITADVFVQIGIWFFLLLAWLSMYLLVIKSIKTPTQDQKWPFEPTNIIWSVAFNNYRIALETISKYIFNSFVITLIETAGMLIVPIITAFAFVRFRFPGKNLIFMSFLALMMIPGTLTLTSQYMIVKTVGLINTIWGVVLPGIAGSIPMSVFLLRSFFGGVSQEMFEAAEIDGARDMTVLLRIMVPLSMPIIAVLGVQGFMGAWNDYLWPSLVLLVSSSRTVSVALVALTDQFYQMTHSYSVAFAGYVISAIPIIVLFIFCSKQFVEGISAGAFKM